MGDFKKYISDFNNILKENGDLYKGLAKEFGMSDCAFWIIYQLRYEGACLTQSEICSDFYVPKQTVCSAIKKLINDGCIEFVEGSNKRSKPICLTDKGVRLAERTVDKLIRAELNTIKELSEDERNSLLSIMRRYTALLRRNMSNLNEGD